MKRVLYLLLFALLAALGNLQPAAAQNAPVAVSVPAQTQVLILVSVEFGGPGIDQYVAALNNSLKKGGIKSTDIHIEYLGLPTLGEKLRAPLARLLREKYRALEFDLVFCIQQPALNFLLNEAQGLAPRAVVLSAYASLPAGVKTEAQKFVFQTSRLDYRGTLQRALELFPRTDSVIVIQGNSEIELARAANIHDDLGPWQGKLQIEDTRALSFSEIDARLEAATPNTVVMGVGILKDAKGQVFLPNESYARIVKHAKAPAFVLYDTTIGTGFVGGMVTRIASDANQLATVGLDVLRGATSLTQLVTMTSNASTPMFDWQQIQRWGANPKVLPADTVFINKPLTLWGQYRTYVIVVALTVGLLCALVIALVVQNRRRRLAELRFRQLVEQAPEAILVLDTQLQRIVEANPSAEVLFGCSRQELLSAGLARFYASEQPDGQPWEDTRNANINKVMAGEVVIAERAIRTLDGRHLVCDVRMAKLPDLRRQLLRASIIDITQRKQSEVRLQLAASVFTHAREGIMITDAAGTIVEVNDTFSLITGFSRQEALGRNPRILASGRQTPEFYAAMWKSLAEKGHWYGETWNRRKNGEVYAEMQTISAVRDVAGTTQHYVALFTDITVMKEQQQRLEHIAHYDALTNLPNRVLLADRLQQAMLQSQRRGKTLAVAYLDLDGFKQVNDRHGHGVGDEMLVLLAQNIKAALREGDTLARIGGDEFVVVLADLDSAADCEPVISRLLQAAAQPVAVGEALLQVSASIGITLYPQDGADADLLLRHADQAMYIAKDAGKNRSHFFDVDSAVAVQTQRESLLHIHHALQQQEFVLHYQPKVNMRTGQVIGAEALIRWQHPRQGLLAPGAFLSVVDNHPLGIAVGEWVIATAIAQMAAWHTQGLDLPVSVNIDAMQLQQDGFDARLAALLAEHPEVFPHCLQLEVLETNALEDMAQVSAAMLACQRLGVSFALDDFGTGYSSLTYLRRLPAQTLKVDQSFVRDMLADPGDLAIVQGVIGLAHTFGRSVIAEGVETRAHGERLLALGCDLAQGYGIARPMPAADLPPWVQRWKMQREWTA